MESGELALASGMDDEGLEHDLLFLCRDVTALSHLMLVFAQVSFERRVANDCLIWGFEVC